MVPTWTSLSILELQAEGPQDWKQGARFWIGPAGRAKAGPLPQQLCIHPSLSSTRSLLQSPTRGSSGVPQWKAQEEGQRAELHPSSSSLTPGMSLDSESLLPSRWQILPDSAPRVPVTTSCLQPFGPKNRNPGVKAQPQVTAPFLAPCQRAPLWGKVPWNYPSSFFKFMAFFFFWLLVDLP